VGPGRGGRLGPWAEEQAAGYLERHGYEVLARNYRCPEGEVDIIARQGETIVFVEVRARRGTRLGTPEESLTPRKARRLITTALTYLAERALEAAPWRIDLIGLSRDRASGQLVLRHHVAAVEELADPG
jgi:putative endonuclease